MGYAGKLQEKELAIKLRSQGLSYQEILQRVSVSKDSISRWCKDIVLTESQKKILTRKTTLGQRKGSIIAADKKRQKRLSDTKRIFDQALQELGTISKRDRFIMGLALYAGEGYKTGNALGFSNANPAIIQFMVTWFKEFLDVPEQRFRGAIWLHENLDEKSARLFWSRLTKIPENQFHKTYIAKNKLNSPKIRKNIHQYGIFSIRVSDVMKKRKILGWISALLNDKIQ